MKKVLLSVCFIILALKISGQVNTDSIFNLAIQNAQDSNYEKALENAYAVLDIYPERYDVMVFISNVYAWKGDYESAQKQIEATYSLNKNNQELYDAWLNILLWAKKYPQLLETTDIAAQNGYQNVYNLTLKRALAYRELEKYPAGISTIENHKQLLDSAKIKHLYSDLLILNKSKAISFYYSTSFFDTKSLKPQHLSYVDYAFKVKNQIFIPRINYAYRFDKHDVQIESDYYNLFNNGHYLYANIGVSMFNELFPKFRAGLEYYLPVGNSMEASLGSRFLKSNSNNVLIVTGHLSKYLNNFWFSLRPYYVIQETKNTLTTVLNSRYYELNPINYWGLELIYGNSPDERITMSQSSDVYLLNSFRVKIEKNLAVFKTDEIKLTSAYTYEEFQESEYRNKFTFEVFYKHKF